MSEKVTISYQGAGYEIGRGRHFYGIWAAGATGSQPLAWWPETAEGWSAAWARFTAVETPGSITPVGGRRAAGRGPGDSPAPGVTRGSITAAALLGVGLACGIAGLFPSYVGQSLASQPFELVAHLIYLAAWAASAALILRGGRLLQAGALAGAGVSIVTLGLFVSDLGEKIAGSPAGAGLWLGLAGWIACTAGATAALWLGGLDGVPVRPRAHEAGSAALVLLAGIGAAAAFAPSWDSYVLRTAAGASETVTAGNAFAQPGAVIAGDVITMVALVLAVGAAALWRPARQGALLLAGATVPLLAQAISAMVQLSQPTSPEQFGITPGEAARAGLTISNGLTADFWVYCVFVVALIACCAWMYLTPEAAAAAAPQGPWAAGPWSAGPWGTGPWSTGSWNAGSWNTGPWSTGAMAAPVAQAVPPAQETSAEPELTGVTAAQAVPEVPEVPDVPDVPDVPEVPEVPEVPASAEEAAAPQDGEPGAAPGPPTSQG